MFSRLTPCTSPASLASLVVSAPVEFLSSSCQPISCLSMALKDFERSLAVKASPATPKHTTWQHKVQSCQWALHCTSWRDFRTKLTLAKIPSPETTPNTIKRLAQRGISPRIWSVGSAKMPKISPKKMEKIGQMLPPIAAPSNPKMMIHHSLALSLRTRCRATSGISLSHSSCFFFELCLLKSTWLSDSTEAWCWRLTCFWGPVALSCWELEWSPWWVLPLAENNLPSLLATNSSSIPYDYEKNNMNHVFISILKEMTNI